MITNVFLPLVLFEADCMLLIFTRVKNIRRNIQIQSVFVHFADQCYEISARNRLILKYKRLLIQQSCYLLIIITNPKNVVFGTTDTHWCSVFLSGSNVCLLLCNLPWVCFVVTNLSPFFTRYKVTHLNFSYQQAKSAKTDRFLVVATDMSTQQAS